jgi:putative transposase
MLPADQRRAMVDAADTQFTVSQQATLLNINRSSLYYKACLPNPLEVTIKHKIDEIYTERPFYGSRRISVELEQRHHLIVNRKAVQRHMREMGIAAIYPGPNLSRRALQHRIFPYLLRGVTPQYGDHIWGIDITYIRMLRGWMYLVAIIDWYSRYIVSWELDDTLEMTFVLATVDRALTVGKPSVFNSDQGSHFTAPVYIDRLKEHNITISMDGKGRALDNVFTERFWRSLKYEEVYLNEYHAPREARKRIARYIEFYNTERPHQSLAYRTPARLYREKDGPCRAAGAEEVASDAIIDRISADL